MPPDPPNAIIAALFDELADLYELDGAVVHRVLAYRNAAKSVREAPQSVAALTREGKVTSLPGIGRTLEEKIQALMDTGTIPAGSSGTGPPNIGFLNSAPIFAGSPMWIGAP